MRRHNTIWLGAVLAVGLVSWWGMDLWANPQAKAPPTSPQVKHRLRVFKLNHTDPEEMKAVLDHVLGMAALPKPGALFNQFLGGGPGMLGGGQLGNIGQPPLGGQLGMLGGGQLGMGGQMGMLGGGQLGNIGQPPAPLPIAADKRTRAVLVRGPEKELSIAADLVAVLDTPPGDPWPKVKNIGIFQLKHADVDRVAELLAQLGFQVVALAPAKILITPDVESLPDLETSIRELDVPARKAPPPEKLKKLWSPRQAAEGE